MNTAIAVGSPSQAQETAPQNALRSVQKNTVRYDDVSFSQVLDAFNPLNHLPFFSNSHAVEPANPLRMMVKMLGGALLGGPIGLATSAMDAVFESANGKGVLGSVVSAVTSGAETPAQDYAMVSRRYSSLVQAKRQADLSLYS